MRGLLMAVFALLLLAAAAAAQRTPPDLGAIKSAPLARIAESQAVTTAVSKVRSDLVSEQLITWGGTGGGIRPSTVAAAGALFNPTGGRAGVYVVPVTAANAKGHVRVVIDAASGQVLSTRLSSWDWGAAPAWWRRGLDASPAR